MKRRRNPKRTRLTPADEGALGTRKENIVAFATQFAEDMIYHSPTARVVRIARQRGLSWVQIRKGMIKAIPKIITRLKKNLR